MTNLERTRDKMVPPKYDVEIRVDGVRFGLVEGAAKVLGPADDVATDVVVPAFVQDVPVTSVARSAFCDDSRIRTVTLPESVTVVGSDAFNGCVNLYRVELPSSVQTINARTFQGCGELQLVYVPFELRRIAHRAFENCHSLKELRHYVKSGPKDDRKVERTIVETSLPVALRRIGESAFAGCRSLESVVIPHRVTEIAERAFAGCAALRRLWLHSHLAAIRDGAFHGCASLNTVRLPDSVEILGDSAFADGTQIVCADCSVVHQQVALQGLTCATIGDGDVPVDSRLGATGEISAERLLDSPRLLEETVNRFEVRPPSEEVVRSSPPKTGGTLPSRFRLDDGVYKLRSEESCSSGSEVRIAMTGDLMCGFRQQRRALHDDAYDFSESFTHIQPVLRQMDLAFGNLETMTATSYPYMSERLYVDDRPHLNAPEEFLAAVRNAGFDGVVNAQNHMFDTGTKGVLETLSALNRKQLIHTGMFASREEPRHLLFRIKGMTVGFVSFLDPARQRMKQANFTDEGIAVMANHFSESRVRTDIAEARRGGAEFVIAYCHWGIEFTQEISERQAKFAQQVADAGADYIFGSHPHCPQHYTVLSSVDGRSVPVVYSGGNFLSDMRRKKPYTQDTLIAEVTLTRAGDGRVAIKDDSYVPCRIVETRQGRSYVRVVPCTALRSVFPKYSPESVETAHHRISDTMGSLYQPKSSEVNHTRLFDAGNDDDLVRRYSVSEPSLALQHPETDSESASGYVLQPGVESVWKRERDTAVHEAVVMCAGSIVYDRLLEQKGRVGSSYEFKSAFKHLRASFESADLAVGSFGQLVADDAPAMSVMTSRYAEGHYGVARSRILDAVRFAGIHCLALANPFNLDLGVRGVLSSEDAVIKHGLIPSGLGRRKLPVFAVNDIRIAVLSHTLDQYRTERITPEGASELLNAFDAEQVEETVAQARAEGARFVIGYLDCSSADSQYRLADRRKAGQDMAERGVDYVICVNSRVMSTYYRHRTRDGRVVPIASSLGTLVSGAPHPTNDVSVLLKITVRSGPDGDIEFEDSMIPVKRLPGSYDSLPVTVPLQQLYSTSNAPEQFDEALGTVRKRIGDTLTEGADRRVTVHSHYQPQVSLLEATQILNAEFSALDAETLKDSAVKPVSCIAVRKDDLRSDCVAVVAQRTTVHHFADRISNEEAQASGARFAIAERAVPGIPTLVVDDPWNAYLDLLRSIRSRYQPITVAVTGTAGKTTTKDMLGEALRREFSTLHSVGNGNTVTRVGNSIQKLRAEDEVYLQEVHEGTIGSAGLISDLIDPNICVITSVADGHLDQMGSIETVVAENMSIIDGLSDDGVLILNNDSPLLRAQTPAVRTLRYSQHDASCDYSAAKIVSDGDTVKFDIVAPDGSYPAVLHLPGVHNVSNALASFAAAHVAGVPAHKIIAGLSRYRPAAQRQNLLEVGGYRVLLDAYNSNVLSMSSALDALLSMKVGNGGRHVVIMGDMGEQGDKFEVNHKLIGRYLSELRVDVLLCTGKGSAHTAAVARGSGIQAVHVGSTKDLVRVVSEVIRPGDALLFKAAGAFNFTENVFRRLFGKMA